MRKKLKTLVAKLFAKAGYYSPKKRFSPKITVEQLEEKEMKIAEFMLKDISRQLRQSEDLKFYEQLLQKLIPDRDIRPGKTQFIGKGQGRESLNVYRKVFTDKRVLFEKIYFSSSISIQKVLWFDKNIRPRMSGGFEIPRLQEFYKGKLVTAAYFDYFPIDESKRPSSETGFVNAAIELLKISTDHVTVLEEAPAFLKDFQSHYEFSRNQNAANAALLLKESGLNYSDFITAAANSALALTHGDFTPDNFFDGRLLTDWDEFGIYPVGFDPAFYFYRSRRTGDFSNWLTVSFKPRLSEKEWKDFFRNAIFFFFVFSCKRFETVEDERANSLTETLAGLKPSAR